jgi:hypothetical protein
VFAIVVEKHDFRRRLDDANRGADARQPDRRAEKGGVEIVAVHIEILDAIPELRLVQRRDSVVAVAIGHSLIALE